MELTFEKWEDGRWIVVLPDYDGDQEDLEMVDGADKEAVIGSWGQVHWFTL